MSDEACGTLFWSVRGGAGVSNLYGGFNVGQEWKEGINWTRINL